MSILKYMVDKTSVNYEEIINYTIDVSLSEISQEIQNAKVSVFVPDFYEFYAPETGDSRIEIVETPTEGGTVVDYLITNIGYDGFTETLRIECRFKYPAQITSYVSTALLYVNGKEAEYKASAPEVFLELVPDFIVTKSVYIPLVNPTRGQFVIWHVDLENIGDKGASITDFKFTNIVPEPVTLADLWPISGSDTSDNRFADKTFDGVTAEIAEDKKSYTFSLEGTYTGTKYTIIVIGLINAEAEFGQYADEFLWSAQGIAETSGEPGFTLIPSDYSVIFEEDPPKFVKRGNFYSTILSFENTGNTSMQNIEMQIDVSRLVSPYKFETGLFGIPDIGFFPAEAYDMEFIYEDDNAQTQSQVLSGFTTNVNSTVTAEDLIIPEGYHISYVIARLDLLFPGMKAVEEPALYAIANNEAPTATSIQNFASISWTADDQKFQVVDSNATNINDNVSFVVIKQVMEENLSGSEEKNGIIRYKAEIECPESYLYEPILVEYLPHQVTYLGNETYSYYDYQNNVSYNSDEAGFPLPVLRPSETILSNGDRVVRFSYTKANNNFAQLKQRDTLTIEFDVQVKDEFFDSPVIQNLMYLGNYGEDGSMGPEMINFPDTPLDLDGDGFIIESLAQSNTVDVFLVYTILLDAVTKTKGSQNLNFVDGIIPVRSRNGADATFRLMLENSGDKALYDLEIINIIPYADDTAITDPAEERGSQFTTGYVESILNAFPVAEETPPDFTVSFCDSVDPQRFDYKNDNIGTEEWIIDSSENTKAVKYVQNEVAFVPGEKLILDVTVSTPLDKDPELVAYNTFAIRGRYEDENEQRPLFMPLEPFRKGIRGIGGKSINGFVFNDLDQSGIYNYNDPGINDIVVALYDSEGTRVNVTTTRQYQNMDGYYAFDGVEDGTYYLIFTIDDRRYKFTNQVLDNELGSKPNKYGYTPAIEINSQMVEKSVFAGLIDVAIENVIEVNKQAQRNMRGTFYSNLALDMKMNDLVDYTGIGKSLYD